MEVGLNFKTDSILHSFHFREYVPYDRKFFRQNYKESIGVAWARFTLLVQSGPNLSLPELLLLQHFYAGLDKESAHHPKVGKTSTKFWTGPL